MVAGMSAASMGSSIGMSPTVRIVAYMVDMASPQMRRVGMEAGMMQKKVTASRMGLRGFGVAMRGVEMAALGSAAAIAATGLSILIASRYTVEFEKQLVNMNSILLENRAVMWSVGEAAVKLSLKYTKSAAEIAEGCMPAGSMIINGNYKAVKIDEYKEGFVVGKNGKPTEIKKWMERPCKEGVVYKIKPRMMLPFKVTPEHPLLAVKTKWCKPSTKNKHLCKKNCKRMEECNKLHFKDYKLEWIKAEDLKKGYALVFPIIKEEKDIYLNLLDGKIKYLDKDFSRFLGIMMGDGSINTCDNRLCCTIGDKESEIKEWLYDYLNKFGIYVSEIKYPGCTTIRFTSKELNDFLGECLGRNSFDKHIPDFMFSTTKENISHFLRGYIDSDGCIYHNKNNKNKLGVSFSTISPSIASTINLLSAKIGVVFSITKDDKKKNGRAKVLMPSGYISEQNDSYGIYTENPKMVYILTDIKSKEKPHHYTYWLDDNYIYLPISWIKREEYHGKVYNYETKDNTYNCGVIVHNSYHLASAGLNAAQIMEVLTPTIVLSVATLGDYADTAKNVIQVLKGFSMEMSDAVYVTDVMAWVINHSLVTWDKLAEGIKFSMPWVVASGLSFEELAAAIGVLTDRALEAGIGGRGLRQSLAMMIRSVQGSRRGFEQLGIVLTTTEGKLRPLIEIVDEFKEVYPEMGIEAISDMMEALGIRGATAFAHLVIGADDFRSKLEGVQDAAGTATRMAEEQMTSLSAQWQLLKQRIVAPFMTQEFAEGIQRVFSAIAPLLEQMGMHFAAMVQMLLPAMQNFLLLLQKTAPFLGSIMVMFSTIVKMLSSLNPAFLQLVWTMALLNKMFHLNIVLTGLYTAMSWKSIMVDLNKVRVKQELIYYQEMQRQGWVALNMTAQQGMILAHKNALAEMNVAKATQMHALSQGLLNATMMVGFGAIMAYASGVEWLGHALAILTGILAAVTIHFWAAAKGSGAFWTALSGPGALAMGISIAAAVGLMGMQMSAEHSRQTAEMNKMKAQMKAATGRVPGFAEGGIVLGQEPMTAVLHPPETVLPFDIRETGFGGVTVNVMPGGIITQNAVDYLIAEIEKKKRREYLSRRGR